MLALTSHSENFGIAVLEALAAGTPVLVTPGVALAPMIQEHRLGYVTELNPEAITQTLSHFLEHLDEGLAAGQRARRFILAHYTWEHIAAHLVAVYQAILDNQPVPTFLPAERPLEPA